MGSTFCNGRVRLVGMVSGCGLMGVVCSRQLNPIQQMLSHELSVYRRLKSPVVSTVFMSQNVSFERYLYCLLLLLFVYCCCYLFIVVVICV